MHKLVPVVGPEMEQTMLTYGQKLEKKGYDEGIRKGVEKGRAEVLQGLREVVLWQLIQRFGDLPTGLDVRVRRAPRDDLQRWAKRILDAATLDEVFADS
ncbi:hypothetical protein [Haliangium sp.]|uniref:hypothetical protein n=1 Tax=Haliangium sp. TaxID=2663208 RepID=UPI003D0CADBD